MSTMRNESNHLILSATSIVGTNVKTPSDEKVGKIEDLMLDTENGEIVYVVLAVDSGFLGMGSKYFALPWQSFQLDTVEEVAIVKGVNKEKLKDSPGFDKDNWPTHPQSDFIDSVYTHYGYEPYSSRRRNTVI